MTGSSSFVGLEVPVLPGVYVPRWQSSELALRAVARLPEAGAAADVCTGSGAIALALRQARPSARIVATDTDPTAVDNARANGIEVYQGDLCSPLPNDLRGQLDVVVAVVPYVPTDALALLPRDTLSFEDVAHYDGGPDGMVLLERLSTEAPVYLRRGGRLLLEFGGDQAERLAPVLERLGYRSLDSWSDGEGDIRGLEAVSRAEPARSRVSAARHRSAPGEDESHRAAVDDRQRGSRARYSDSECVGAQTT